MSDNKDDLFYHRLWNCDLTAEYRCV